MYRKAMQDLMEWKESQRIFWLTGCRGTGKTWLALEYAKNQYPDHYLYLNMESNTYQLIERIQTYLDGLGEQDGLILLDELSFLPEEVLQEVLGQRFPNQRFLLISSFPSMCDHLKQWQNEMCCYNLSVMDFEEYLYATGSEWYVGVIEEHYVSNKPVPDIVHQELMEYFREYLMTGGFPALINELLNMGSTENHFMIHQQILHQIYHDLEIAMEGGDALKSKAVLESIPLQLSKSNKVFRYRSIRRGATRKQYQSAIDFLQANRLVLELRRYTEGKETYQDEEEEGYKLYYPDTGVLYSMLQRESTGVELDDSCLKGIYENHVALMLQQSKRECTFWESGSQAKIEFLIRRESDSIPVEIKVDENTRSKSVSIFREKHDIPYSIKLSTRNFDFRKNVKYLPVYAAFCLKNI